jgi:hypothetical protein
MGHIAPEYLSTGKSSEKTDVFGYGITLLELVTGQRAIDLSRLEEEEEVLLLDHVRLLKLPGPLQNFTKYICISKFLLAECSFLLVRISFYTFLC